MIQMVELKKKKEKKIFSFLKNLFIYLFYFTILY